MKKAVIFILTAALCVLLAACGEQKAYDEACDLFENGHYAEAIEMFRALGSYSDSPARITIAQTRLEQCSSRQSGESAENERALKYSAAMSYIEEGRTREAYETFAALGDYRDAAAQLDNFSIIRGALVSEEIHYISDGTDTLRGRAEYAYGADGTALSRSGFCRLEKYGWFEDFNYHYTYNDASLVSRIDAVNASGTLSFSIEYEYSEGGRVVRELYSDSYGTKHELVYEYSNGSDADGSGSYTQVVESEMFNGKPFPEATWQYSYCEFGVSSVKCGDYTIVYEYDADGRCVCCTQSYADGSRCVTDYCYGDVYLYTPAE